MPMPDYLAQILQINKEAMWVVPGSKEERDLALAAFVAVDNKRGWKKMFEEFSSTIAWAEMRHNEYAPHQAAFRSACEVAKGIASPFGFADQDVCQALPSMPLLDGMESEATVPTSSWTF
ncbi:hypothetical protein HMI48_00730 [Acidithiobacillus ferrooxidans]|uniref:hypothetical protein n=1 Tax=Acidithiobacillus ferrooxidans TaxID=920 RepID=UPI001C06AD46|nr:hypothetical protein [Acidithiobacillus ferrooxidans]MBU2772486.1 hypothetical protein [Acidithiobacillus ferrooxidans]